MIFAARHEDTLIISSASTFEEYEVFKRELLSDPKLDTQIASRVMLFTDERVKSFQFPPVLVNFEADAALGDFVSARQISILTDGSARSAQYDMMADIVEQIEDEKNDRRTLGEIFELETDDPWDRSTEQQREDSKKLDEKMKELRKTGGLTGDSFGGKVKKGINVHEIGVAQNKDGTYEAKTVGASKSTLGIYKLEGAREELEKVFNLLQIPLNRIEEVEGGGVEVMLHSFQIKLLTDALHQEGITYTLTRLGREAPDLAPQGIYWRLSVKEMSVADVQKHFHTDAQGDSTFDPVYSEDIDDESVYFFEREAKAEAFKDGLAVSGVEVSVEAVNQKNEPILSGASGAKIVDRGAVTAAVTDPRVWNDRAKEWPKRGKKKIEEAIAGIKCEEYCFTVQNRPREQDCLVWFAPLTYFEQNQKLYHDGPLFLDDKVLPNMEKIEEYLFLVKRADQYMLTAELCHKGFRESWMLRFRVNSQEELT